MEIKTNEQAYKPNVVALKLIDAFTQSLFTAGHTITKPMIKQCAMITVQVVINELQDIKERDGTAYNRRVLLLWKAVQDELIKL